MDATIVDALFILFAVACAGFVFYGGWLCLRYGSGEKQLLGHMAKRSATRWRTWTASLAVLATLIAALGTAEVGATTNFEDAMRDYEHGEYVLAHMKFRVAAEKGDARAQEVLGLMYAFGPQLYPGVAQDMRAAGVWLDRAARGGRPTARYAYCALVRKELPGRAQGWKCFDWVTETGEPPRR